jgi:hypothetical protein
MFRFFLTEVFIYQLFVILILFVDAKITLCLAELGGFILFFS